MSSLISIIIPVYNAKRYLAECLDSVLAQSYSNFEILIIDDGSTDGSADICKTYATKDQRIRYIYQENAGVSAARNKGLDEAKGTYISFVDADDLLVKECLEELLKSITTQNVDSSCCGVFKITSDGQNVERFAPNKDFKQDRIESIKTFFRTDYFIGVVWAKLYKKSLIDRINLRFDERFKYSEDYFFNYSYIRNGLGVSFISECLYKYRIDNVDSAMNIDKATSKFNIRQFEDNITIISEILKHAKINFQNKVCKVMYVRIFAVCRMEMIAYLRFGCEDKDIMHILKAKMRASLWYNLRYGRRNFKTMVSDCVLTFIPSALRKYYASKEW